MSEQNKSTVPMIQSNSMIDNRGNWGLMENRIYYSILKRIDAKGEEVPILEFPISEVIKDWDLTPSSSYKRVCEAIDKMAKQVYRVDVLDEKGRPVRHKVGPFFMQLEADKEKRTISVELNKKIEKDFIKLKNNFTKTDFGMLMLLTKGTSQRLYDLLMEYKGLGKRVFHARELERKIKPNADESKPYDRPNKIEERLVAPAVEEINEKTNLNIKYQKFGRGEDTHYEFDISEKDKKEEKPKVLKLNKAEEVIKYLNEITGHRYSLKTVHPELNARLKDYSVEDCKKVIEFKYDDWKNWEGRDGAMNPTTLFRKGNFSRYLEQANAVVEPHKPTGLPTDIPGVDDDGYINLDLAREAVAQGRRWYKDPSGMKVNF